MNGTLISDREGARVDVSRSYRGTIIRIIGHLTGRRVTRECIQAIKNRGGFSDDWAVSHVVIPAFSIRMGIARSGAVVVHTTPDSSLRRSSPGLQSTAPEAIMRRCG